MSGSPRPTTSLASSDDVTLPGASFCMRFTGRYGEETFPDHVKENKKTVFHSWLSNSEESVWQRPQWDKTDVKVNKYWTPNSFRKPRISIIILEEALEICAMWLRNPEDFKISAARQAHYQETILVQVFKLDYWLHQSRNNEALRNVVTSLFPQGGGLLRIAKRIEDLLLEPNAALSERAVDENTVIQNIRSVFNRGESNGWDQPGESKYANIAFDAVLGDFVIVRRGLEMFRRPQHAIPMRGSSKSANPPKGNSTGKNQTSPVEDDEGLLHTSKNEAFETAVEESSEPKRQENLRRRKILDPLDQEIDAMSAMYYLMFRAALYGCLLNTGADNSCALDMNIAK
jgi:hypothetical protein